MPFTSNVTTDHEALEEITNSSQYQLKQINIHLLNCTQFLKHNSSLFTRISLWWGEFSKWQQILIGMLVIIPLLLIGYLVQIAALTMLEGCIVTFLGGLHILLDDHQQHHTHQLKEIELTISTLTNLFGIVIENLETTNGQLTQELQCLKSTNETLTHNGKKLQTELIRLNALNTTLEQNNTELSGSQQKLQQTIITLEKSVIEQQGLLKNNQIVINETTQAYNKNQSELAQAITELAAVKQKIVEEGLKAQKVIGTLQTTVASLSKMAVANEQQRAFFSEKLNEFMAQQQSHFDAIVNSLFESEQNLTQTVQEIGNYRIQLQSILKAQEDLIQQLKSVKEQHLPSNQLPYTDALKKHGFYSEPHAEAVVPPNSTLEYSYEPKNESTHSMLFY